MASRRPGNDRAAQNAQTLKALVKLEGNKVCADCKRNKHPRWASWNLGVFLCIRCSGVHRGMGTHISRVKSVDLDAWTDEQLQSILKWGNARANKYWEARLATGHQPSEAKIENFIRTKYESKRWVIEGPIPDPATLDVDDDVPLNLVQEKAKIERSASQRLSSPEKTQVQRRGGPATAALTAPAIDLFGDMVEPPSRSSSASVLDTRPTRIGPPPSKPAARTHDSLLNLDFFGNTQPSAARPSSAASNPTSTANTRGDLKNSILSLYASAPPKPPATQPIQDQQAAKDAFGGLADAFSGLNFASTPSVKSPPAQSPPTALPASLGSGLGGFGSTLSAKGAPAAPQVSSPPPPLSGGSFFDAVPTPTVPPAPTPAGAPPKPSSGLDFSFTQRAIPASPPAPKPGPRPTPFVTSKPATSIPADLFNDDDFGGWASTPAPSAAPAPTATVAAPAPAAAAAPPKPSNDFSSAFNLSAQATAAAAAAAPAAAPAPASTSSPQPTVAQGVAAAAVSSTSNALFDPWSSAAVESSPWGAPEPAPSKPSSTGVDLGKVPSHITPNDITGGWGAPISGSGKSTTQPRVTADEDFGAWTSDLTSGPTTQTAPAPANPPKPSGGFGGASDPFDNPWG